MGFNKGVEERMIETICLVIIDFVLLVIATILVIDNYRLSKEARKELRRLKNLEDEMRFKFNLREINK